MTKMSSPIRKANSTMTRKSDLKWSEKESDNIDDVCNFLSSNLKRKADGKCGSPTSSKDSHSDRDSDYDDSNSELQGNPSRTYVCRREMTVSGIFILMYQNNALLFNAKKSKQLLLSSFRQMKATKARLRRSTEEIEPPSRPFNSTNLSAPSKNPTTPMFTRERNLR